VHQQQWWQYNAQAIECKGQHDVLTYSADSASLKILVALVVQTQGELHYHLLKETARCSSSSVMVCAPAAS
jgi:hypothetical protein